MAFRSQSNVCYRSGVSGWDTSFSSEMLETQVRRHVIGSDQSTDTVSRQKAAAETPENSMNMGRSTWKLNEIDGNPSNSCDLCARTRMLDTHLLQPLGAAGRDGPPLLALHRHQQRPPLPDPPVGQQRDRGGLSPGPPGACRPHLRVPPALRRALRGGSLPGPLGTSHFGEPERCREPFGGL